MALVRLNTDQSGLSGRSDMILPARSSILKEIQDVLGDEKISSEMRAFCELCEEVNLEPLAAMSKDELVTLSGNCKKAIAQCRYYNSSEYITYLHVRAAAGRIYGTRHY